MKKANNILQLLEISEGSVVSIVGCGGKTSLIELIAEHSKDKKVLVSPTTKMFPMVSDEIMLCDTQQSSIEHEPKTGIQCLGQYNERTGVLEALPLQVLSDLVQHYDIVLLESDGSRGLPCKGWRDHEPVIPDFCTHTLGVLTMCALGKTTTNDVVHHLDEFISLTGIKEGETITAQALEDMVCLPKGMFKSSVGNQYLVINMVEDEPTSCVAKSLLFDIRENYPNRFKRLVYGNVFRNDWHEE